MKTCSFYGRIVASIQYGIEYEHVTNYVLNEIDFRALLFGMERTSISLFIAYIPIDWLSNHLEFSIDGFSFQKHATYEHYQNTNDWHWHKRFTSAFFSWEFLFCLESINSFDMNVWCDFDAFALVIIVISSKKIWIITFVASKENKIYRVRIVTLLLHLTLQYSKNSSFILKCIRLHVLFHSI